MNTLVHAISPYSICFLIQSLVANDNIIRTNDSNFVWPDVAQKHSLGEPCIIESLHPKNLLFVGSGSSLLTSCLVSTLDSLCSLNTEARVIHLVSLDHITPLLKSPTVAHFICSKRQQVCELPSK